MDANVMRTKESLDKPSRQITASLRDISTTVKETSELASLADQWSTEMVFSLNLLLTKVINNSHK